MVSPLRNQGAAVSAYLATGIPGREAASSSRGTVAQPFTLWSANMKRTRLISMMFLGLLLVAGTSCTTDNVVAPAESNLTPDLGLLDNGGLLGTGLLKGLLYCRPLASESVSEVIGPRGGTIKMGPHTIYFPPNALSRNVTITAEVVSDSVNSVRLLPEGLRFAKGRPATLTLSYSNCAPLARLVPKRIVYTNEHLGILQILQSLDNILSRKVSAPLEHFSRYAVAY